MRNTMAGIYKERLTGAYWSSLDEIILERDNILAKISPTTPGDETKEGPTDPSA